MSRRGDFLYQIGIRSGRYVPCSAFDFDPHRARSPCGDRALDSAIRTLAETENRDGLVPDGSALEDYIIACHPTQLDAETLHAVIHRQVWAFSGHVSGQASRVTPEV